MEEEEQKISFVTNFKEWDKVYSPGQKTPEQIYEQIELKSSIVEALNHLSERERKVLIMRFGLEDGWDRTLSDVGREFKLTPERIRQIEAIALRKLKHPTARLRLQRIIDSYQEEVKIKNYEKIADLPVDLNIALISTNVYENLIHYFAKNPEKMKTVDRRKFEEIIAELFYVFGFNVELTKQTRDGGRDIIAIKDSEVLVKYIIEAKRPDPETPVRIGPVRALYGVKSDEGVTKAILATTTYFTRDAKIFFDRHKWELEPRDFKGIMNWIDDYLNLKQKK